MVQADRYGGANGFGGGGCGGGADGAYPVQSAWRVASSTWQITLGELAGMVGEQEVTPTFGGVPGGGATPPITFDVTHHSVGLHIFVPQGTAVAVTVGDGAVVTVAEGSTEVDVAVVIDGVGGGAAVVVATTGGGGVVVVLADGGADRGPQPAPTRSATVHEMVALIGALSAAGDRPRP
jgi:hypothetical protein